MKNQEFPEPKKTSVNVLFYLTAVKIPKYFIYCDIKQKKLKIFTLEKLNHRILGIFADNRSIN